MNAEAKGSETRYQKDASQVQAKFPNPIEPTKQARDKAAEAVGVSDKLADVLFAKRVAVSAPASWENWVDMIIRRSA